MTGGTPRVSVVMPVYNAERFCEWTLRQLSLQTFGDFEVVVVNDGSTDGTTEVVRRVARDDPRIRLIEQENGGIACARNRGIAESRGDLIALLDHDDRWHPRKLELQVACLDARPEVALVSCYSAAVDQDGRCLGWRLGVPVGRNMYPAILACDVVSGGSVALVRTDALRAVGLFDERLGQRSDWDLWIRLARRFPFGVVRQSLVGYTRGGTGVSRSYHRMAHAGAEILSKVRRDDPRIGDRAYRFYLARDTFAVGCFCIIDGNVRDARAYLRQSIALTPAPILQSTRRMGVVLAVALASVLPAAAYERLLTVACRVAFGISRGEPFNAMRATRV